MQSFTLTKNTVSLLYVCLQPSRLRHFAPRDVLSSARERGLVQDVCPPEKDKEFSQHLNQARSEIRRLCPF